MEEYATSRPSHTFHEGRSSSNSTLSYGEVVPRSRMPAPTSAFSTNSNSPSLRSERRDAGSGVHTLPNPYDSVGMSMADSSSSHMLAQKRRHDSEEATRTSSHPNATHRTGTNSEPSIPQRTLDDVKDQVASSIAIRTVRKAEEVDGSKIGVVLTLATASSFGTSSGDEACLRFIRLVSSKIKHALLTSTYIFIIGTSGLSTPGTTSPILIISSNAEFIHRASVLVSAKFVGRLGVNPLLNQDPTGRRFYAEIRDLGQSPYDEQALWDVVRKSARNLIDPLVPPPDSLGIRQILTIARSRLQRITPLEAYTELQAPDTLWPVVLVDIRPEQQRIQEGEIPGALIIERNVLEWRFDPRGKVGGGEDGGRLPIADRFDLRVIIFCQEGYTSSLAAASLHDIGMLNTTDIVGGLKAWKEAGLPVHVQQQ
ncbi:hypothetical protein QCA50_015007 [Cerrena zonata]|uniref:Rhodanese domain-containing protein n=1 Tax=Cerrena zonata TaxID=2478898 RepID=A0AAW0FK24_9APHY